MKKRILLVEDEETLLQGIKMNLELEGYAVSTAIDGRMALKIFKSERFDLVVLDVMLPEIDGFQVCETIRIEDSETPILMLTAKSSGQDRIKGLKKGADDYLPKPFNLEELILRVVNLLKRTGKVASKFEFFEIGDKQINFPNYEVTGPNDQKWRLSKKEAMLLKLFIERESEAISRELILETVWGYDIYPSTRTIDNFILNLRKMFEEDPRNPKYFHSIRGVGYQFINQK
ncbi:MAG: two-component system alkaline phosphatase synthesis response regulator PhoP [Sphingobacteriales bacterium]|jgi:two-component system alkaline phosphatase synthesis response regulator PhoP